MKTLLFVIINFLSFSLFAQNFKSKQIKFERVSDAFKSKWPSLGALISSKGIDPNKFRIFIRVLKEEKQMEVWISKTNVEKFVLLKTYEVAKSSGVLGPKREEGDLQVPEGFYHIDRFNPLSSYYLSLGINYPNNSDKILGKERPGNDIFLHGSNVTVGCVPITDDKIKEVYALAVQAKNSGQKEIYVHIFPFEMSETNLARYADNPSFQFWGNLKSGYNYFEIHKKLPKIKIMEDGRYKIKE